MSEIYGPHLPTEADLQAAYEDWGDAMLAEAGAAEAVNITAAAVGHFGLTRDEPEAEAG
jgi:hypothetical protein